MRGKWRKEQNAELVEKKEASVLNENNQDYDKQSKWGMIRRFIDEQLTIRHESERAQQKEKSSRHMSKSAQLYCKYYDFLIVFSRRVEQVLWQTIY